MSHVQHLESIPFQPLDQMTTPNRYVFTTGGDPDLVHKRKIDGGAVGEVHDVRFLILTILLVLLMCVALPNFIRPGNLLVPLLSLLTLLNSSLPERSYLQMVQEPTKSRMKRGL